MSKSPISSALFDLLDQYVQDLLDGRTRLDAKARKTSPVLVFCQNFFAQFFENEVKTPITSFGPEAKRVAVSARGALKAEGGHRETILLITWFEKLCDIYPDVLALGYGGSAPAFKGFLQGYVVKLLQRTSAWARIKAHKALAGRSDKTLELLRTALARGQ